MKYIIKKFLVEIKPGTFINGYRMKEIEELFDNPKINKVKKNYILRKLKDNDIKKSFERAWKQRLSGDLIPISELWKGTDA